MEEKIIRARYHGALNKRRGRCRSIDFLLTSGPKRVCFRRIGGKSAIHSAHKERSGANPELSYYGLGKVCTIPPSILV